MRQITIAFFVLLSLNVAAQGFVTERIIKNDEIKWHFTDSVNLVIEVNAEEGISGYILNIKGIHDELEDSVAYCVLADSIFAPEIHTINVNLGECNPESVTSEQLLRYYYEAELVLANNDSSPTRIIEFYVSPHSMLNNPEFQCDYRFLKQGVSALTQSIDIPVESQDPLAIVEGVEVILDFRFANIPFGITSYIESPDLDRVYLDSAGFDFNSAQGVSRGYAYNVDFDSPDQTYGYFSPYHQLEQLNGTYINGEWKVKVEQNTSNDLFGGCVNFHTSLCMQTVSGLIFFDTNSDGEWGEEESAYSGIIENSESNGYYYTNETGEFQFCSLGDLTIVQPLNPPSYYQFVPDSYELDFTEQDSFEDLQFALQPIGEFDDLEIDLYHTFPDRPGFDNTYYVSYQNVGTTCIDDASVVINLDPALTIDGVEGVDYTIDGNTITAYLGTLCYPESGSFVIHHTLSEDTPIGTILENTATIQPIETDYDSTNNIDNHESEVFGSYDPNDKLVTPEEFHPSFLETDQSLEYMIRFQNTGTFYAENVVIVDTMDSKLDLGSFELVSVSHNVEVEFEGNEVSFIFNDIFLADSTANEPESHGYVRYRIRPKDDMSIGESIDNTAYIYFDFNEPIITNTTSTPLTETVGVYEIDQIELTAFPNPAENEITVMWPQGITMDGVVVLDLAGKEAISLSLDNQNNQVTIPISKLSSGIYIIESIGETQAKPIKMIKH